MVKIMELTYDESVLKYKVEAIVSDFETAIKINKTIYMNKLKNFIVGDYSEEIKKLVLEDLEEASYKVFAIKDLKDIKTKEDLENYKKTKNDKIDIYGKDLIEEFNKERSK